MKFITLLLAVLFAQSFITYNLFAFSAGKSICGEHDARQPSNDPKIGRAFVSMKENSASCTVTMIGRSCAITAGHCKDKLKYVEFEVPMSNWNQPQRADQNNIYRVDQSSIIARFTKRHDFAVLKLLPNQITGELAGDRQGYYLLSFKKPKEGDRVRVTGHGIDLKSNENQIQQSAIGVVTDIDFLSSLIYHNVDTMGGNSGSPIIQERDDRIVGVHTWGQCSISGGSNVGTLVKARKFRKAIKECLRSSIEE